MNINEGYAPAYGSVQSPMGGMKDSGLGRRHGSEGILKYTEAQTVAHQRIMPMAPSFGMDRREVRRVHEPQPEGDEDIPVPLRGVVRAGAIQTTRTHPFSTRRASVTGELCPE